MNEVPQNCCMVLPFFLSYPIRKKTQMHNKISSYPFVAFPGCLGIPAPSPALAVFVYEGSSQNRDMVPPFYLEFTDRGICPAVRPIGADIYIEVQLQFCQHWPKGTTFFFFFNQITDFV